MKKILLFMLCMILLVGTVSAPAWGNVLSYSNNDLKVTLRNSILWIFPTSEIGTAELKSHSSVNEIREVGLGNQLVMWYDFNFVELYLNGLGKVEFTDMRTGKEIDRDYSFVYWGEKERDVYGQGECFININGTQTCESIVIGKEIYETWLPYNSKDIPKGNIRIGLITYVEVDDKIDGIWTITGRKINKHAEWYANAIKYTGFENGAINRTGSTGITWVWFRGGVYSEDRQAYISTTTVLNGTYSMYTNSTVANQGGVINRTLDEGAFTDNTFSFWMNTNKTENSGYTEMWSGTNKNGTYIVYALQQLTDCSNGRICTYDAGWIESPHNYTANTWIRQIIIVNSTGTYFFFNNESTQIKHISGVTSIGTYALQSKYGYFDNIAICPGSDFDCGIEIETDITITYPTTTTYSENVSELNYTYNEANPDSCWYSKDNGATNSSSVSAGTNFDGVTSIGGSNTWTIFCNDTSSNIFTESVTFNVTKIWSSSGYPFSNESFRVKEFINVSGNNFTLAGQPYALQGLDAYYLFDYATNHTYDDQGNEINNSRYAVLEILNEAQSLGINVIRTWANSQGSAGSNWIINESGGHYNLFVYGEPSNYSNNTLEALDWVISETSKRDIRLQLVLINNWDDYGGMRWYVMQSPTTSKTYQWINDTSDDNYWVFHDQFYTDENCRQYYRDYINMLLNRNNTVTGILYKNDPTIFSWLLANEPRAKSDGDESQGLIINWTKNMTAYIKSIDSNHLVGLGIEGWGDPFDGTSFVDDHNGTGVDFATFELHPEQWDWFAQRSEGADDLDWIDGGITDNATLDWWTIGTGYSFNNRYEGSYIPNYNPALARHGYHNWIKQNVEWANDLGMPVLLQEVAMPTSSPDSQKNRFYEQTINSFYSNGGDGLMFWNLNHDNYYYSTDPDGIMDDGYSFYVSDDPILKAKSQSVIDAINFTKYDNEGGSWIRELSQHRYDFVLNVGFANDFPLKNCTLNLNVSNGTDWTGDHVDQVNSTQVYYEEDYTFIKHFNSSERQAYWYTQCFAGDTQINSTSTFLQIQTANVTVNLVSPENNSIQSSNNLIYNVSGELDVSTCNLYFDDSLNKTDSTVLKDVNQTFTMEPLSAGNHSWYVQCTDIESNIGTSETRIFTADVTPPVINITYPTTQVSYHIINTNLSLNWTVSDDNLDSCWFNYNFTNTTVTCADNTTNINITNYDNRNITFYANDTLGYMTSMSRSWDYTVFENSQTFNNETFEGIVNTFIANVTIIESNSITIANLIYNGTSYSNSFSQSGNESILTIDFLVPNVDADINLTFFWSLTLLDGQIINLTSHNQTVIVLSLDDCSVNTVVLYNYTVVDEKNQSILSNPFNTTTELNINLLDITRQNYIVNFSKKYLKINPFAVCINKNLSSSTYLVDSIVKYEAVGYSIEYYNIINATITNSTIPVDITLYDLFSADATEFKITFKAEDFTFVENALIYIDRQYIAENNTFKTVELPKTDSNGQTVGHFVRNDVVYNIRVVKDGEVLGNFKNIIAFCEDYTIGACQMILEAIPGDLIVFEYDEQLGIIFQTLPTYNEDASSISFDFSTNDGSIKTVSMDVTRDDIFGNRSICNNTLTSSSGTLVCSFDPNIDDSVLRVSVSVDGQPIVLSSVRLESSDYGNLGYVLWFFLTFLFVLVFGYSKTEVLIGLAISFIGAISLGITRGDIIGLGSAGIWVLLIIILGIVKLNRDKPQ